MGKVCPVNNHDHPCMSKWSIHVVKPGSNTGLKVLDMRWFSLTLTSWIQNLTAYITILQEEFVNSVQPIVSRWALSLQNGKFCHDLQRDAVRIEYLSTSALKLMRNDRIVAVWIELVMQSLSFGQQIMNLGYSTCSVTLHAASPLPSLDFKILHLSTRCWRVSPPSIEPTNQHSKDIHLVRK
jgi:hypothetical protein